MRMWEFDDNRAIPSNMVLEQDFILRIRRLHRLGTPHLVANLLLTAIEPDYSGRGSLEEVHNRLQALILAQKGVYAEVSNGDVFLIWPESLHSKVFPEQAMMVTLPNGFVPEDLTKYILTYHLPDDYPLLRERANYYIDASRNTTMSDDENSPARLLQTDAARGPLTAWSVNQIERLMKDIDLCHFIRSQSVYQYQSDKSWRQMHDECFIGLEEVRKAYFPHLDVIHPPHLFLELCELLDKSLLEVLTQNYESVLDLNLSLNLSLPTVLGTTFAQFAHRIPRAARQKIGFEINCGDLLQDFGQTLNTLATLRQEGFKITLDGLTPDMLGYFNFARFDVDFLKVNVSKDRAASLKFQTIRSVVQQLPKEKVIFFHCDSEQALAAGIDLGITRFQGWLIDDQARKWRKA